MDYVTLGNTNIRVSKIAFGTLTVSPLQKNLLPEEACDILIYAIENGINFFDTAELYSSYPHLAAALAKTNKDIVVATKSYAYSKESAEQSFELARKSLNRDVIDIFLMHEQVSEHTIKGHWEAFETYLQYKKQGKIRALGISTHHIAAVEASLGIDEIEIISPMLNYKGVGIVDGNLLKMEQTIEKAYNNGKGIYGMKAFGGGSLLSNADKCLNYAFDFPYIHSFAIGMQTIDEVKNNLYFYKNRKFELVNNGLKFTKKLHIEEHCIRCENCVKACPQKALSITSCGIKCDYDKCVTCGYCSAYCKEVCIKFF